MTLPDSRPASDTVAPPQATAASEVPAASISEQPLINQHELTSKDGSTSVPYIAGRSLVSVRLCDGGTATATTIGLAITPAAADADGSTRCWSDVDTITTDPATLTMTVTWVDGTSVVLAISPDGSRAEKRAVTRFGSAVREAVRSSVVHTRDVVLPRGGAARIAIRRDEDGELFSQVIGQIDLSDPVTCSAVDAAEVAARETVGLPS